MRGDQESQRVRGRVEADGPKSGDVRAGKLAPARGQVERPHLGEVGLDGRDCFDLVALTSLSAQIYEAYKVADTYRGRGTPV